MAMIYRRRNSSGRTVNPFGDHSSPENTKHLITRLSFPICVAYYTHTVVHRQGNGAGLFFTPFDVLSHRRPYRERGSVQSSSSWLFVKAPLGLYTQSLRHEEMARPALLEKVVVVWPTADRAVLEHYIKRCPNVDTAIGSSLDVPDPAFDCTLMMRQ